MFNLDYLSEGKKIYFICIILILHFNQLVEITLDIWTFFHQQMLVDSLLVFVSWGFKLTTSPPSLLPSAPRQPYNPYSRHMNLKVIITKVNNF